MCWNHFGQSRTASVSSFLIPLPCQTKEHFDVLFWNKAIIDMAPIFRLEVRNRRRVRLIEVPPSPIRLNDIRLPTHVFRHLIVALPSTK